jgi:hypothetical protein
LNLFFCEPAESFIIGFSTYNTFFFVLFWFNLEGWTRVGYSEINGSSVACIVLDDIDSVGVMDMSVLRTAANGGGFGWSAGAEDTLYSADEKRRGDGAAVGSDGPGCW